MNTRFLRNLGGALLVLGALVTPAVSQMTSGDLAGTVNDATGGAVPGTVVEIVNQATGLHSHETTTADGLYHFANLPVGRYNLTATASGFAPTELKDLAIDLNKIATANLTLQVGTTTTSVEVTESSVTIDTSTAQITNSYDAKAAADLPSASSGSGVLNLSLLEAGVASSGGVGAGSGPSVGGNRPRNNNFTIEGIDNNSKSVTGPLVFIPNDAVQEFTLISNQYTAEYGHSSGGQFNTNIKSGSNQFHGEIYDYEDNKNFNAIDQQVANSAFASGTTPSNSRFDANRLGATFGGPIKKNKLFFFMNFEYNPRGQSSFGSGVYAPTAAGYQTLSQIPGINQTLFNELKQFVPAAPTQAGTETFQVGQSGVLPSQSACPVGGTCYTFPYGLLPISGPNYTNGFYGVSSVDYNISDKDQLRGRFIYNKTVGFDTAAELPAFWLTLPTTFYLSTLTEYHNFSPSVTNEFRLGYNRFNNTTPAGNFTFPGLDQFPNLQPDDNLGLQIGPDGNAPQFTIQNLYQATDNITWTWNKHTFKFGFDGRKYITPQSFTQRARGDYEYSNMGLYLFDYQPDDLAQRTTGNYIYYGDQVQLYGYAQDTFKATEHLSLNLGVRYEFTSLPYGEKLQDVNIASSVPGLLSFTRPQPQYLNFAPRIGIAYSPGNSGTTSVRAGFGMAYDVLYDNLGILSAPPQFQQTVDVTAATDANGNLLQGFLANGGISPNTASTLSVADARASTSGYIPNQKLPYTITWNADIQHVFARNYTIDIRYVGTHAIHLPVQDRIDQVAIVQPGNSLPTYLTNPGQSALDALPLTLNQLTSAYSATATNFDAGGIAQNYYNAGFQSPIVGFFPIGSSYYDALDVQLDRRLANGLFARAAYTWSHNIDNSTADVFTTVLTPRRPEDFLNLGYDKADSALDRRQRATLALIYDVPFFSHNSNFIVKNIIGNWEIAPIYTYQTPERYTVQSGVDSNINGDSAPDRAILNSAGVPGTGSGVTALTNSAGQTVAYLADNPNAQYITAGKGVLPNVARNTLPGRPIDNVDFTAIKRFSVGERYRLEIQAQFYNALNHPQFLPGFLNDIGSIGFTSGAVRSILEPSSPTFNQQESVFSSNPRSIQFAAKLFF